MRDHERSASRHSALGYCHYRHAVNIADLPGDEHFLPQFGSLGVAVALLDRIEELVGNVGYSAYCGDFIVGDSAVYREKIAVCGGVAGRADNDVSCVVCGGKCLPPE